VMRLRFRRWPFSLRLDERAAAAPPATMTCLSPRSDDMTRRCELSGKLPMAGQIRSHAENKTKRTFRPNLCRVTLISETLEGRKVRLRVSAHALKTVEHRGGLDAYLLKASNDELSLKAQRLKREIAKAKAAVQPAA